MAATTHLAEQVHGVVRLEAEQSVKRFPGGSQQVHVAGVDDQRVEHELRQEAKKVLVSKWKTSAKLHHEDSYFIHGIKHFAAV